MTKVKVYQYGNCSTCKKALKHLDAKGVDYASIDITEQPPTKKELQSMLKLYDGNLKKLFNTSGQVYREKKLGEKLPGMTESQALDLLAKNGKLVKRPFVLTGAKGAVGFKPDEWKKIGL
jgi:arsenate reductase